jgi:molybdopterin converting factor small subunit
MAFVEMILMSMRLKILLFTVTLTTILVTCAWYENTFRINYFATKNRHLISQRKIEIMNETNVDSLRQKAIKIYDNVAERHGEKDLIVERIQGLLTWASILAIGSVIILLFEIWNDKRPLP